MGLEYRKGNQMARIILIAGIVFFVVLIIIAATEILSGKKKSANYTDVMRQAYFESHSVLDSLIKVQQIFKKKSIEYLSINKAIYYLQHSIMRDYDTAFGYIESVFVGKNVVALHEEIIENERRNIILLISKN